MGLLAQAYATRRGLEMRIPGAAWAPLRIERGPAISREVPASLHESEARIQNYLEQHPQDPRWLLAEGRAELLEHRNDKAIETLRLAIDLSSPSSSTRNEALVDLASAYYGRGLENRPLDFSTAADLLGQVIQADPSLALAYFNRALAYEKLYLYDAARDDWKSYLRLDLRGSWHDEASQRLADLDAKTRSALNPAGSADLAEVRLDAAMRGKADPITLPTLAARLEFENGDHWLRDALAAPSPELSKRLGELAESRAAMRIENFPKEAEWLNSLARPASPALAAWADFELLFRQIHPVQGTSCAATVNRLIPLVESHRYAWLETQTWMERSSCEIAASDIGAAESSIQQALALARRDQYPVAELRSAGIWCDWLAQAGQYREAAAVQDQYLSMFWLRPYPLSRAQQFYVDMAWIGESRRQWRTGAAALSMAASLASSSGWKLTEAVDRSRLAGMAIRAGMKSQAVTELARAKSLFLSVPDTSSVMEYRATAESASAELSRDTTVLSSFRHTIETSSNAFAAVPYLRVLANFERQSGDLSHAEADLRAAIGDMKPKGGAHPSAGRLRTWRDELRRDYEALVDLEATRGDADAAYRDWQEYLHTDSMLRDARAATPLPAVAGTPARLVTYARLGNRYAAWFRDSGKPRFAWVSDDASALDAQVRRFAALIAEPHAIANAAAESAGRNLRGKLLDGFVTPSSGGVPLLVQADGELERLPWAALPGAPGELLGESLALAIVPASVAPDQPVQLPAPAIRSAVIVEATSLGPDFVNEYPPLPGIEAETAAARASLPDSAVLSGNAATAAQIERAWPSRDVFHFAGHAAPSEGGIRLLVAPDPHNSDPSAARGLWLPGGTARSPIALAVLGACSTARSGEDDTPEPAHVASALLQAGARQALATLWDTDSLAAQRFMTVFYQELARGQTAAAAASQARRRLRQSPGYQSSYYWAPFALYLQL